MADSSTSRVVEVPARIDDLKYMQASNVNVSNYVSVKLSSQQNYEIWKAQIVCLLESQQMRGIVEYRYDKPDTKNAKIVRQYDKLLKGWIFGSVSEEVLRKVVRFESAVAVWKELESFYTPVAQDIVLSTAASRGASNGDDHIQITVEESEHDSDIHNKKLYKAIVKGSWWKAHGILKIHKDLATQVISENGDTMLHLAVGMGKNHVVENLLNFIKVEEDIERKNSNGETALHVAAKVGNIHAARLLVKKREELLIILDFKARSPLLVAYNNLKLEMYVYLLDANSTIFGSTPDLALLPSSYQENAIQLIVIAMSTKQYELAMKLLNMYPFLAETNDSVWRAVVMYFPADLSFGESLIYPSSDDVYENTMVGCSRVLNSYDVLYKWAEGIWGTRSRCQNTSYIRLTKIVMTILIVPIAVLYPLYELICFLKFLLLQVFSILYFHLWKKVLAIVVHPIREIEKKKNQLEDAKKIMSFICYRISYNSPGYNIGILEAVRRDVYEVIDEISSRSPIALNCCDEEGYNLIQLAIMNRSIKVYNLLCQNIKGTGNYDGMVDSSGNNLVHLVGRLAPRFLLCRTTGAALQLQRELQWREEVKKLMSPRELVKKNFYLETPEMVFTREHEDLVKEGEKWMKTTAESCSITAALIVTIVFAAAITVPGGSKQETGIPVFKNEIAFIIFAVFDAISLFTATTSLLVFLSVLTTRFAEKDFQLSLPRRLIFGLCALIVSTAAMIVAFGATLVLIFGDQRSWVWAPIIGGACLPVGVIVSLQLPLVVDLWFSTYIPIFGKQSYMMKSKTIRMRGHSITPLSDDVKQHGN